MAMADYYLCDHCGRKGIYDGDDRIRDAVDDYGIEVVVLCAECAKTHEITVAPRADASPAKEDL